MCGGGDPGRRPHDTGLCVHSMLDYTDLAVMMDDKASHNICRHKLGIKLNRVLARVISPLIASLRLGGALNVDVTDVQTNRCFVRAFTLCSAATRRHLSEEGPP